MSLLIKKKKTEMIGKSWGELTEEEKEKLSRIANLVSGIDSSRVKEGKCIVDFEGYNFSIPGEISEDEIKINSESVFYDPTV